MATTRRVRPPGPVGVKRGIKEGFFPPSRTPAQEWVLIADEGKGVAGGLHRRIS